MKRDVEMSDIKFGLDKRVDFIHAIVCSYVIRNNYAILSWQKKKKSYLSSIF